MRINTGNIFGICMGAGVLIGLLFGQKYMTEGLFSGLGIATLIVLTKNKRDEKNKK